MEKKLGEETMQNEKTITLDELAEMVNNMPTYGIINITLSHADESDENE